jgi:putative glutamine amidotransferase
MQMPLIAVSPNSFPAEDRHFYKHKELEYGDASIAAALKRANALPSMVYRAEVEADEEMASYAEALMPRFQGLVLTGGSDLSPTSYGETPLEDAWRGDRQRDRWEMALYHAAVAQGLPVLAICRGAQLINVAEGGTLWQDLPSLRSNTNVHRSQDLYCKLTHDIDLADDTRIARLFGDDPRIVNSVHHQGLRVVAPCFTATAWAPDGVVEAIERAGAPWVLGVQWHPEWMPGTATQQRIFAAFVNEACAVNP